MNNNYKKLMAAFMTATLFLSGCGNAIENKTEVSQVSDAQESTSVVTSESENSVSTSGESFESTGDNEHAITADGESLSYDGITVNKTGAGEGDESDGRDSEGGSLRGDPRRGAGPGTQPDPADCASYEK